MTCAIADMKSGSGSRDSSLLRHKHLRADDVTTQRVSSSTVEASEIVERGRTRNMVSRFEVGSKVNACGSGSRTFDKGCIENKQKVIDASSSLLGRQD